MAYRLFALAGPLGAALVLLVPATEARACGGFFCDQANPNPPVQREERIVFVEGAGQTTAVVQILYEGEADDFAWVVPMGAAPTMTEADPVIFDDLAELTTPEFTFRYKDRVETVRSEGGGGCGGGGSYDIELEEVERDETRKGVRIVGTDSVGPYRIVTLMSDDAGALHTWLTDNGYGIPAVAGSLIEHYTDMGAYFVALKLQSEADVKALSPIAFTYPSSAPGIPLILTSVASTPVLDVTAYFVAESRMMPANFAAMHVDFQAVRPSSGAFGSTTYPTLLSTEVAAVDGHGFVTEYAMPIDAIATDALSPATRELLGRGRVLTRLFTSLSQSAMDLDPFFVSTDSPADIDRSHVIDLRDDPAYARVLRRVEGAEVSYAAPIVPVAFALLWLAGARRRRF